MKEYKELREFFQNGMKTLLIIDDDIDNDIDNHAQNDDEIEMKMKTKKDLFREASNEECSNMDETESSDIDNDDDVFFYNTCPCIERLEHILEAYQKLKEQPDLWVCTCFVLSCSYLICLDMNK